MLVTCTYKVVPWPWRPWSSIWTQIVSRSAGSTSTLLHPLQNINTTFKYSSECHRHNNLRNHYILTRLGPCVLIITVRSTPDPAFLLKSSFHHHDHVRPHSTHLIKDASSSDHLIRMELDLFVGSQNLSVGGFSSNSLPIAMETYSHVDHAW